MITHKQLSLAEVFENFQNNFDNDRYLFLLFPIFTPEPEDHASTSFILAQGTSIPAYFLNPDRHAPDCVFEVLSGIV